MQFKISTVGVTPFIPHPTGAGTGAETETETGARAEATRGVETTAAAVGAMGGGRLAGVLVGLETNNEYNSFASPPTLEEGPALLAGATATDISCTPTQFTASTYSPSFVRRPLPSTLSLSLMFELTHKTAKSLQLKHSVCADSSVLQPRFSQKLHLQRAKISQHVPIGN